MEAARVDAVINFIFDRQDVFQTRAFQTLQEIVSLGPFAPSIDPKRFGLMAFANSAQQEGLQAADLFTHAWYSYFIRGDRMSSERKMAMDVLTRKRKGMRMYNAHGLEVMLGGLPQDLRARLRNHEPG